MKARTEEMLRQQGLCGPRAEARPRRHPRHRVRGAAPAARARPPRPDDPVRARRSTRSSSSRPAATSTTRDARAARRRRTCGCAPSSTGSSSSTSSRRTRCPTDADARTRLARVLGFRDRRERVGARRSSTPSTSATRRSCASIHEKLFFAPLLDTLAGVGALLDGRGARSGSPRSASATSSRRAPRCDELTAGLTRRSRVMQQLLPGDPRVAVGRRPTPTSGCCSCAGSTEGYTRSSTARPPLPRDARSPPSARAASSARQPRARRRAAPPTRLRRRARRRRRARDRADARRARRGGARHARLARGRRAPAAPGSAASSAASCCASARATCSGSPTSTTVGRELSHLADACVEAALQSLEPTLPFAVIGLGRLGGARAVVRVRHRRDVRVRRRRPRPTSTRRSASRPQLVRAIGETHVARAGRSASTRALRPEGKQGPLARSLDGYRDLLRALGADVGVPGAHQGPRRRRRRRRSARGSSTLAHDRSCTATRSPTSGGARSAA